MTLDPIRAPTVGAPGGRLRGPPPARRTPPSVRLPDWEGPLGLLLALVEARRLDVLTVPLGGLAEAYLDALALGRG